MLIVVDGVEGSGNKTILKRLGTILGLEFQQKFVTLQLDCGPGQGSFVLRTSGSRALSAFSLLYEDVHTRLIPALQTGAHVICGSFISYLYAQHAAIPDKPCSRVLFRNLEREVMNAIHIAVPDFQMVEILLDVKYDAARTRSHQQPGREVRTRQQFMRQRIAYLERSKRHLSRTTLIDTTDRIVPEVLHLIVDEVYKSQILVPPHVVQTYSGCDSTEFVSASAVTAQTHLM